MDNVKLETFLFVCKEKSFTKAAEKLFITPATGKVQTRELRVGHSAKFNYGFITDIMGGYEESYPDNSVRMERIKKTELPNALQKHFIDCFLYINPQRNDFPGIAYEQVGTTRVHAIIRRQHPYAQKELITKADLEGYEIYFSAVLDQELYNELTTILGASLHILDTTERNDLMSSLQHNAIFLYPCPVAYNISIPFDYPSMDIRLFYNRNTHTHDSFAQHLRQLFQDKPDRILL